MSFWGQRTGSFPKCADRRLVPFVVHGPCAHIWSRTQTAPLTARQRSSFLIIKRISNASSPAAMTVYRHVSGSKRFTKLLASVSFSFPAYLSISNLTQIYDPSVLFRYESVLTITSSSSLRTKTNALEEKYSSKICYFGRRSPRERRRKNNQRSKKRRKKKGT